MSGIFRQRLLHASLIALPSLLDGLLLVLDVITQKRFFFNAIDIALAAAAILWLGCSWWIAGRRAIVARTFLVVIAAITLLGAAELAVRVLRPKADPLLPRAPMRVETMTGNSMPGISGKRVFSANRYGVRAPDEDISDATTRILTVGGSSVECLYVTDEETWPWLLQSKLSSALGRKVCVGNAGKAGHFVRNHEYLLQHYRHAAKFDTVVVMCGVNDLGALLREDYDLRVETLENETLAEMPPIGAWYRRLALTTELRKALSRPRAGTIVQDSAGDWNDNQRAARRALLAENPLNRPPEGFNGALDRYKRDLRALIHLCAQRKQRLLFITQPTLYSENLSSDLEALLLGNTGKGAYPSRVLAGMMADFNRTLLEVCREDGVECFDLVPLLPKDTSVFYDDCHFNTAGCARVAELVGGFLVEKLRNPLPR